MKKDDFDSLAMERAYYLPPVGSGAEAEWQSISNSQETYADLCRRGQDIIANRIIDGRQNGNPPTIKELYKLASKIRHAIAIVNESNNTKNDPFLYGMPLTTGWTARLFDRISQENGSRYHTFFDTAESQIKRIEALVKSGNFKKEFGSDYEADIQNNAQFTNIHIYNTKHDINVASIVHMHDRGDKEITLWHARLQDRDKLFAMADENLNRILSNDPADSKSFWNDMGEISLDLYHTAPLQLGSQTATLMILAGITKAMGYEVLPRRLETDHFIEAELHPYVQTVQGYGNGFIHTSTHSYPLKERIAVDDSFIEEAQQKIKGRYFVAGDKDADDPLHRMALYLNECRGPVCVPVRVTSMDINNGHIKLSVEPPAQQSLIDYTLDFTGHEEAIRTAELPRDGSFKGLAIGRAVK